VQNCLKARDYYVNYNYNVHTPGEANFVTDSEFFLRISNCIFKVKKFITKIFTSVLFLCKFSTLVCLYLRLCLFFVPNILFWTISFISARRW